MQRVWGGAERSCPSETVPNDAEVAVQVQHRPEKLARCARAAGWGETMRRQQGVAIESHAVLVVGAPRHRVAGAARQPLEQGPVQRTLRISETPSAHKG